MSVTLVILSIVFLAVSLGLCFVPKYPAVLFAYVGMLLGHFSGYMPVMWSTLLFWGIATLIVVMLTVMLPREVVKMRNGLGYISGGSLVGMMLGLLLGESAMIVGAAVGSFLGCLAYSRTPAGRGLKFPSNQFTQYMGAKGLPVIITMCIVGIEISAIIVYQYQTIAPLQ